MPSKKNVVERKIQFFRIRAGCNDAGEPLPFDAEPVLRHLEGLPYTPEGNYWSDGSGDHSLCAIDCCSAPQRLRFGTSRRTFLPQVEENGAVSPLSIPATAGLAEWTHIMFFPGNVLGAEFNFYGPRVSRLRGYLRVKAAGVCGDVTFEQLLRNDALEKLRRLRDIRLFQLNVQASYAETLGQMDEALGDAFDALRRAGEAEQIEVVLKPRFRSRTGQLSERLIQVADRLLRRDDFRESANRFIVKGADAETGISEPVDLLSDQLIARRQVVRHDSRTRAVDPESAFGAIESAYDELREEIEQAASVGY